MAVHLRTVLWAEHNHIVVVLPPDESSDERAGLAGVVVEVLTCDQAALGRRADGAELVVLLAPKQRWRKIVTKQKGRGLLAGRIYYVKVGLDWLLLVNTQHACLHACHPAFHDAL